MHKRRRPIAGRLWWAVPLLVGWAAAQTGCDIGDATAGGDHTHGAAHNHDHGGHGSGAHGDDHAGHGSAAHSEVAYDSGLELFVEFPHLVVDREAPFSAHVSTVDGYDPADRGTVSVVLTSESAPGERFESSEPVRGGLYRPVATPEHAGTRHLFIVYRGEEGTARFRLGDIEVHESPPEPGPDTSHEHEGGGGISFSKEQQWRVDFATGEVRRRSLQRSVPARGIVRPAPDATARVRAPFAGRVLAPGDGMPDIGDEVEAGESLAVIAPTVDANALPMLRADLSKAKTEVDRRERKVQRLERLVEQRAVPKSRLLDARSDLESARADVEAARERIDQYQSFGRAGRGSSIHLRAPVAGEVVERPATSGEYLEPGDLVARTLDTKQLRLEARVAEANLPRLERIGGVWFERDDGNIVELNRTEESYFARIDRIDPETRTNSVWFGIPDDHDGLTAGQYHRVHLQTGEPEETLAVASTALLEEKGVWTAYVLHGGESFERRRLEVGMRDGGYVEIVEGLEPGERVVTRGALYVKLASATTGIGSHSH